MQTPKITKNGSYKLPVIKGKTYIWCGCGLSQQQPFCDGSHKNSKFKPITYEATHDGIVGWCGCRKSAKLPFCDGSHKNILTET